MDFEEKIEGQLWTGYYATRQNQKNTQSGTNWVSKRENLEFQETSIFYIHHLKEFWETI